MDLAADLTLLFSALLAKIGDLLAAAPTPAPLASDDEPLAVMIDGADDFFGASLT